VFGASRPLLSADDAIVRFFVLLEVHRPRFMFKIRISVHVGRRETRRLVRRRRPGAFRFGVAPPRSLRTL